MDVIALSLVGCAAFSLLIPVLPNCSTTNAVLDWALIPGVFFVAVVCVSFASGRFWGWTGLRHLFSYPPPWIASLFGIILFFLYAYATPLAMEKLDCAPIEPETIHALLTSRGTYVFLGSSIVLMLVAWRIVNWAGIRSDRTKLSINGKNRKESTSSMQLTTGALTNDFNQLTEWIANDQPVSDPKFDAFGRDAIARRIASVLGSTADSCQTIALVGEPGAGKSTILRFTTQHLGEAGKIGSEVALISVSLWPFDSVEAAVRGILTPISAGLARHVNTSPIAGLPDDYINAIESTGQGWARLLKPPQNPAAILASYDRVATAIGLRIVLWIEDVERFAGMAVNANTPEIERLEPIRSLLNLLSEFRSLRVILASASLSTRFDIEKFARVVESVPQPSISSIWKILHSFRRNHLLVATKEWIDPVTERARHQLEEFGSDTSLSVSNVFGVMTPALAIATLCLNPRRLKYGLRYCQEAWIRLRGEIDFDDLLAISVLRAAAPDVFSLVNDFIDELRAPRAKDAKHSKSDGVSDESPAFVMKLDAVLVGMPIPQRTAVRAVLNFVFPGWEASSYPSEQRPQGLSKNHRDYWVRYLSPGVILDSEKDQRVLRSIYDWKEKKSGGLVEMLAAQSQADSIVEFSQACLTREELLLLLGDVVMFEKTHPKERAESAPGSFSLIWNMMIQHQSIGDQLVVALGGLIETTIQAELYLAYSLERCFSGFFNGFSMMTVKGISEVRAKFESALLKSFVPNGATQLIESVKGGFPWLVYYSSWGTEKIRSHRKTGLPFSGWSEFSNVLLDAAELEPDLMLPQIVPFLVEERSVVTVEGNQYSNKSVFSLSDEAGGLFNLDRLAGLVQKNGQLTHSGQWIQQAYQTVREALGQHAVPNSSPSAVTFSPQQQPRGSKRRSKAKK